MQASASVWNDTHESIKQGLSKECARLCRWVKKNVNVNGQALHCPALHNSGGHCSPRTSHPLESWHCGKHESIVGWEAVSECAALAGWQCICDSFCARVCVCARIYIQLL